MGTTKAYDDLVEVFRAKISGNIEREEGNKGKITTETIEQLGYGKNTDLGQKFEEALAAQPKRRGRPKGSKNKPKTDAKA